MWNEVFSIGQVRHPQLDSPRRRSRQATLAQDPPPTYRVAPLHEPFPWEPPGSYLPEMSCIQLPGLGGLWDGA